MIDLTHLKNLLGNDEMAARFLNIFREQAPLQMDQLSQCAEAADWEGASIAAHGLKSQLRYLGLEAAAGMAYEIEKQGETGNNVTELASSLALKINEILAEMA